MDEVKPSCGQKIREVYSAIVSHHAGLDNVHFELNLLIQFKLDGGSLEPELESNGNSTNALRQKLKRLLKKLRQLARER